MKEILNQTDTEREARNYEKLRDLAPECMVLLKSDETFPIDNPSEVALYGCGARNTIKGGTGSGDVHVKQFSTIEKGLENAGFKVTTKTWLDNYELEYKRARKRFIEKLKEEAAEKKLPPFIYAMGAIMPEPEYEIPLLEKGKLAVYVLARVSGEGADRKPIAGDFFLTQTEIHDILYLNEHFEQFILVLNVGGVVDLSPVMQVKNILLLSQLGMTTGDSFADVILGKGYPSGKLTATWAPWDTYKNLNFGNPDDTIYEEGIFVGYRGFEKNHCKTLFPFGYGCGFTEFKYTVEKVMIQNTKCEARVIVQNIGKRLGKEVIQLYLSKPQKTLEQPIKELVSFQKTRELKPGEKEALSLSFDLIEFPSYDEKQSSYILEEGMYGIRVGTNCEHTMECGHIYLEQQICVRESANQELEDHPLKSEIIYSTEIQNMVKSLTNRELAYLCVGGFAEKGSDSIIGNAGIKVVGSAGETTSKLRDKGIQSLVMADGPAGLRLATKYGVDENGKYPIESGLPDLLLEFMDEQTLKMMGEPNASSQARQGEIHYQYCTAMPIGTAVASSFNLELMESLGDIVGQEMERFQVELWLAPALNIQRSPLCGRNFEYFSEDPYISGKAAAAITKGVQSHPKCGVTVKHFCCNNQETNRYFSNSVVDERTLRELYLRGFEIVMKEAKPAAIMTSYNLLNGEHTSSDRKLLTGILRNEWGYEGLIMTDWVSPGFGIKHKYEGACAAGAVKAGNNLSMPGGEWDIASIEHALENEDDPYHITREDLEVCAAGVVKAVWNYYKE